MYTILRYIVSACLFRVSSKELLNLFELISVDFRKLFTFQSETELNCNLKLVQDRRKFH